MLNSSRFAPSLVDGKETLIGPCRTQCGTVCGRGTTRSPAAQWRTSGVLSTLRACAQPRPGGARLQVLAAVPPCYASALGAPVEEAIPNLLNRNDTSSKKDILCAAASVADSGPAALPGGDSVSSFLAATAAQAPALAPAGVAEAICATLALGAAAEQQQEQQQQQQQPVASSSSGSGGLDGQQQQQQQQQQQALLERLIAHLPDLSTSQAADLAWRVADQGGGGGSRGSGGPVPPALTAALCRRLAGALQDLTGGELSRVLCALGMLRALLPPGWAEAAAEEAEFQLAEFPGDFEPLDLARLVTGMADLRMIPSPRLREVLIGCIYTRLRTVEDKAAVDFALTRLDAMAEAEGAAGEGKRSMHFDPRWTHEELHWLPRRERDKKRIIKQSWYRTVFTGWSSDNAT